jgi:hypothetical protein
MSDDLDVDHLLKHCISALKRGCDDREIAFELVAKGCSPAQAFLLLDMGLANEQMGRD